MIESKFFDAMIQSLLNQFKAVLCVNLNHR